MKKMRSIRTFLILLVSFSVLASTVSGSDEFSNKVNLALRQTGDALLLHEGDSTSVVPPIAQNGANEYVLEMNDGFNYKELPYFLERAFKDYGIDQPYQLMVRSCETGALVLGFNRAAIERDSVACRDRSQDIHCAMIHIQFSPQESKEEKSFAGLAWLLIPVAGLGGIFLFRKKETHLQDEVIEEGMKLGSYRFNSKNQKLSIGDQEFDLTFRESKLLNHFAVHANEVLNRDDIMAAVWEDEGIVVGRSLDVFISRLRKILKADSSISIKTVHGVGYRLEIQN
jgi:DNA-binding winged helix-turn-helix (wHTH) protein